LPQASLHVDERMIQEYREMNTKTRSQLFVEAKMAQLRSNFLPKVEEQTDAISVP
jgi:hypothetical protein